MGDKTMGHPNHWEHVGAGLRVCPNFFMVVGIDML